MKVTRAMLAILLFSLAIDGRAQFPPGVSPAPSPTEFPPTRGCWEPEPTKDLTQSQIDQRAGELREKLQLSSYQVGAWNDLLATMKRPIDPLRGNGVGTGDQQVKKMLESMNRRHEAIEARQNSFKQFYGKLRPEQKKRFDVGVPYPWTLCIKE